jgi:transcriptional antiterminator NusG
MTETKAGRWYVVHTLSGHEQKVKDSIEKRMAAGDCSGVYEVLVPMEKISEVKQGRKTTSSRKYYPGYVLVRMDLTKEGRIDEGAFYFIRHTQGVIGFIGSGNNPIPLSPEEERDMMGQIRDGEDKVLPKIDFEIGENVKIRDGAFENFEGSIEEIDNERGKLKILVSIFGRSTPVELEYWQVEREA